MKKILFFVLIILSLSFFIWLKPEDFMTFVSYVKEIAERNPFLSSFFFFSGAFFFTLLGIPRSVICIAAGTIFGFWKGFIISSISVISGSFVVFSFSKHLGAPFFYERLKKYLDIIKEYKGNQLLLVLLIRQIPMPCLLNNILLGLTSVSSEIFIIGTFLAQLPTTVIFTLYGSSIHGNLIFRISLASFLLVIFLIFLKILLSRSEFMRKIT